MLRSSNTLAQPYQPILDYQKQVVTAPPSTMVTNRELFILGIWIASFTVGLDVFFELKLYDIVGVIAIWHFRSQVWRGFRERSRVGSIFRWLVVVFVVGFLVSIVRVGEPFFIAVTSLRLVRLFLYFSIFLVIRAIPFDVIRLRILIWVFTISCLGQAILIFLQEQGVVPIFWSLKEVAIYGRLYSTGTLGLNHINQVLYMSLGICAALSLTIIKRKWIILHIAFVGFACTLMVYAILVGEARSGLVALAVILMILAIQFRKIIALILIIPLFVLIDASLGLENQAKVAKMWDKDVIQKSAPGLSGVDAIEALDAPRPKIWGDSLLRLSEDPTFLLIGAGFQNYKGLGARGAAAGHNMYLHVLVELGIVGLFIYIAFLLFLFKYIKRRKNECNESIRIKIFGIVFFGVLLVLGLFNESLYPQRAIMGFMGFALAYLAVVGHHAWSVRPYLVNSE